MKTTLDHRDSHLCVLYESQLGDGSSDGLGILREWYPVREATEGEVAILVGRPVNSIERDEGLYADEEGNPYQLSEQGRTRPLAVEMTLAANDRERAENKGESGTDDQALAEPMAAEGTSTGGIEGGVRLKTLLRKPRKKSRTTAGCGTNGHAGHDQLAGEPRSESASDHLGGEELVGDERQAGNIRDRQTAPLNLRQKLAEVRRRIGYIQKRGHNEVHRYRYVTAADIAGAVGDILAELGVVVVPRLESISHEPARTSRSEVEHLARVLMAYTFMDVDTAEEITVKVAGEGLDVGDKAPYKAMTGALKYALLQSFLLATGDDPEDERADYRNGLGSERVITPEQVRELQGLIEETGTELERVLAYYRISALGEMTEGSYRRALELLNRKLAKQSQENGAHAQD
jgi:hypothetical protein